LGPVMLLVTLNGSVPRYFVSARLGDHELGVFAALSYLVVAGTTMVGAMGQSLSPKLARHHANGDVSGFTRLLSRFLLGTAALGIFGIAVAALGGRPLLTVIYSPAYGAASSTLVVIMIAGSVGYVASVLGYGLTATRQFSAQVPLMIASVAVTAAGAALLVPTYGIAGAAWATAFGAMTQIAASILILVMGARRAHTSDATVA